MSLSAPLSLTHSLDRMPIYGIAAHRVIVSQPVPQLLPLSVSLATMIVG